MNCNKVEIMKEKVKSDSFNNIRQKIDKLHRIVKKYLFSDLVRAIYCINICVNNRSLVESCIALNACLVEYQGKGKKRIENYKEFYDFFYEIYPILKPTLFDDVVVEDFGEVRINFNEVFYRVIIGTGHSNVYACMKYLPSIARHTKQEFELTLALEYYAGVIEYFLDFNSNDNKNEIRYVLPSKELFNRTKSFFDYEISRYDLGRLASLFDKKDVIEKKHFTFKGNRIYPIYNTSLLVDLYDTWERKLTLEEKISVVNTGIIERISNLFWADRGDLCQMYAPSCLYYDGKPNPNGHIYTFAARGKSGFIIALNADEYQGDSLEDEIFKINSLHKEDKMIIGEVIPAFGNKHVRVIGINKEFPISFLIYNSISNPSSFYIFDEKNCKVTSSALDVIFYLDFMDNVDELFNFINHSFEEESKSIIAIGGVASLFLFWKKQGYSLVKGALNYDIINIGYNIENDYVVTYFKNKLSKYPFIAYDFLFRDPAVWKVKKLTPTVYDLYDKYAIEFRVRLFYLRFDSYILQKYNIECFRNVGNLAEYQQFLQVIDGVISEGIDTIKNIFISKQVNQFYRIHLMFMPIEHATEAIQKYSFKEAGKYFYSYAFNHKGNWMINFSPKDMSNILSDLFSAKDRSVEINIIKDIFMPLLERSDGLKRCFEEIANSVSKDKKKIGVIARKISYVWDNNMVYYSANDSHFHVVRKRIAKKCFDNGVIPGRYKGKEANTIIRNMQRDLIEDFEKEVSKYSKASLHKSLLDYYSTLCYNNSEIRIALRAEIDVDDEIDSIVRNNNIKEIENNKIDVRNTLYVLETNLFLDDRNLVTPKEHDIQFLLAYAHWLIVLNDVADVCHYGDKDMYIDIREDYVVDNEFDINEDEFSSLMQRIYNNEHGLLRDEKIDEEFFNKTSEAFIKDTGLDFNLFIIILIYFSSNFNKQIVKKIGANVYSISKKLAIEDCVVQFKKNISEKELIRYFDFLTIKESDLKTIDGKSDFYLPIGNRSKRNNRFETKPLLLQGDDIIFSPITLDSLKKMWISGITNFILPYEIGLTNTIKIISEWKKNYEKKIVTDIANCFSEQKFDIVKSNFELIKLSKAHPNYLGDYDVLAVDTNNKLVWIIECKVIMLSTTLFDIYKQQKRFFLEHKEDEKFQRRIDYMQKNLSLVLEQLGCQDSDRYKLLPYMCMNKVMISRVKKINFPIVSFQELTSIIRDVKI